MTREFNTVTIWTGDNCPECTKAIAVYKLKGFKITEIKASLLLSGEIPDIDALASLAAQGMKLPVIQEGVGT